MKEEILVVFENHIRAAWFIEDKLLPLMPYLKHKGNGIYESDTFIVRPVSLMNENNLRGRRPDLIYLTEECTLKQYNLILQLVQGDHNKVRVVM